MYVMMIVPSDFPNGDAGAVRDMAFAKIYQDLGYQIVLAGAGKSSREGFYQGVHYYSIYREAKSKMEHLQRFLTASKAYMKIIKKTMDEMGMPAIIHINSIPERLIDRLISLTKGEKTVIVHDSTEWYSPCEFPHGKLDKAYILKDRLNRIGIRKPIRVIGISSFLTEYFKGKGLAAVRVPAIMDVSSKKISENSTSIIKLVYAGSPANKDYLRDIVLGATSLSSQQQSRFELHIFGAEEKQICDMTTLQHLPECIKAYGRVPRETVEEKMIQMDFSVLLRPTDERYAKAGFPTKVVEAMSHGVAMICNISSDLEMYLRDGENAILVEGYDKRSFARSLERVLAMNRDEINELKANARSSAELHFDYHVWEHVLNTLINESGDCI